MTASWTDSEITEEMYSAGTLPVPGWPDGSVVASLPDATTVELEVVAGRAAGAEVFVWNHLRPGAQISSLAPNGQVKGAIQKASRQRSAATHRTLRWQEEPLVLDEIDVERVVERHVAAAIRWVGTPCDFESVWSFVGGKGLEISPQRLSRWVARHYTMVDDGTIYADGNVAQELAEFHQHLDGWDPVESAYWDLEATTDRPSIDPVFRKRRKSENDGLEYLLDEISHQLLTAEQEAELGRTIVAGQIAEQQLHEVGDDWEERERLAWLIRAADEAREAFAAQNLRLVFSIARKYRRKIKETSLGLEDMQQEGYAGLLKAIEKFDTERGLKFSTYATWWIRQAITRAIANDGRTIRIPVHIVEKLDSLEVTRVLFYGEHGRHPTSEDLANELDTSLDEVESLLRYARSPESLDELMESSDQEVRTLEDLHSADDDVDLKLLASRLAVALNGLSEREQRVIRGRNGLGTGLVKKLEELGGELGVTRERVRQIEQKALSKLRSRVTAAGLFDWLDGATVPTQDGKDT